MNQAKSDFEASAQNAMSLEQKSSRLLLKSLSKILSVSKKASVKHTERKQERFLKEEQLEKAREKELSEQRANEFPKVPEYNQERKQEMQARKPPPLKKEGKAGQKKTKSRDITSERGNTKLKEPVINKEEVKKEVTNQTKLNGQTRMFSVKASELTRIVQTLPATVPFIVQKEGNNYFLEINAKDIPVLSQAFAQQIRQKVHKAPQTPSRFKTYNHRLDRSRR